MFKSYSIVVYIGLPGSGKSTYSAKLYRKYSRRGVRVYSNYFISGAYRYEPDIDLGHSDMTDSLIIIDEGGLSFDNRNFKTNFKDRSKLEAFVEHRHDRNDIAVFSQTVNVDLKILQLAESVWIIKKSLIPGFSKMYKVKRKIGTSEDAAEITDLYNKVPFSTRYFYRPLYYKYFDSFERTPRTPKDFVKWEDFDPEQTLDDFTPIRN